MSAIALLEPDTKPSKTVRKARISPKVRDAIRLMVDHGRSRADAAAACGITDDWLYRALERPECRAYRNHLMQVFRESAASRSLARVDRLADSSTSESVKFESNKLLLGLDGHVVTQKTESLNVHKHLMPGLTIVTGGWAPHDDDARVIDGQAHEAGKPHKINMLGTPVPHPLAGNVPNPPEKATTGQRGTRGEK